MADPEQRTHADLLGETIESSQSQTAGTGSVVYNESAIPTLRNDQDDRLKTVLINHDLIPAAGDLLVDVVTYPPGVENSKHYHEGTDHFFYVLEGSCILELEDQEIPLTKGSIAWLGDGDAHKVITMDEHVKFLEYYSNNDHIATRVEGDGEGHTWKSA